MDAMLNLSMIYQYSGLFLILFGDFWMYVELSEEVDTVSQAITFDG
jgi:hypothetical protein